MSFAFKAEDQYLNREGENKAQIRKGTIASRSLPSTDWVTLQAFPGGGLWEQGSGDDETKAQRGNLTSLSKITHLNSVQGRIQIQDSLFLIQVSVFHTYPVGDTFEEISIMENSFKIQRDFS